MTDKLQTALKNADTDFERKTLQYIQSLRDRPVLSDGQRNSTSGMKLSDEINVKSPTMIHENQPKDFSQKTTRTAKNMSPTSSMPKNPVNSTVSFESNDSLGFGFEMMLSDTGKDVNSLSYSKGSDPQLSQSSRSLNKPLKKHVYRIDSLEFQHSLKGSEIPEDLAKINMLDSLNDYEVRVIFNRGN